MVPGVISGSAVELYYDKGSPDVYFVGGDVAAVKFTVNQTSQILQLKYYLWNESTQSYTITVHVLDENFNSIYSKTVTSNVRGWLVVDISQDNVLLTGNFFVAIQRPDIYPWLGYQTTPPYANRSYLGSLGNSGDYKVNENYLIRAVVTPFYPVGGFVLPIETTTYTAIFIIATIAAGVATVAFAKKRLLT